jgi:surface polysaccharide O-acyltransferase-like enzyme
MVAIVAGTPLVWQMDLSGTLAVPVAAFLNAQHGSLFPLFPWAAFLFAGAVAGYVYLEHAQRSAGGHGGRRFAQTASSAGVILIVASFLLHPVGLAIYPVYDYWHTSPSFYLLRLGIIMVLCAGMFLYEATQGVRRSSAVTLIGRQSLVVYVVHLMLVYGRLGGESFHERVGRSFGYAEAMVTSLILLVLMYLLALAWERIKRGPAPARYAVEGTVLAAFVYVFFFVRWN